MKAKITLIVEVDDVIADDVADELLDHMHNLPHKITIERSPKDPE